FTLFQGLTVLACSFAVLSMGVHAEVGDVVGDVGYVVDDVGNIVDDVGNVVGDVVGGSTVDDLATCDPDIEIFCSETNDKLMADLNKALSEIPPEELNADPAAAAAGPARRRSYPVIVKRNLFTEVGDYFKKYWEALGLIAKGEFGEGIFKQLKNAGSWCNKDDWVVKAVKKVIERLSLGGLTAICECLVPMIDQYESYDKLKEGVNADGLTDVLTGCSKNMRKQIKGALKRAGSITKIGGRR
ncbi:hypothetical protein EC991_005242, partial [Linnemannia zychae]